MHPLLLLAGAGILARLFFGGRVMEPWTPPTPVDEVDHVDIDPGVNVHHPLGKLPCPENPPPPVGFRYWQKPVTQKLTEFAVGVLNDSDSYPMGAFVQTFIDGEHLAARVEWHSLKGSTGETGCFRGVNLMEKIT